MSIDLQEKIDLAQNLWADTKNVPQSPSWWGFYSYGDAPPAIGGGIGSFVWFSQRSEMLKFIVEVLPYAPPGRADLDWDAVAHETAAIIDQMSANLLDDETAISKLNATLVTFSQIEWMGTYTDLLAGDHAYAKDVRAAYWSENGENKTDKIEASSMRDFEEFLSTWGVQAPRSSIKFFQLEAV